MLMGSEVSFDLSKVEGRQYYLIYAIYGAFLIFTNEIARPR